MFDGDYRYELAKRKMDEAIRAHEHDVLGKQVRSAARSSKGEPPRKSMIARGTAVVTALFK
jgi:hypothetical protein